LARPTRKAATADESELRAGTNDTASKLETTCNSQENEGKPGTSAVGKAGTFSKRVPPER
jgi:hypothetical protein